MQFVIIPATIQADSISFPGKSISSLLPNKQFAQSNINRNSDCKMEDDVCMQVERLLSLEEQNGAVAEVEVDEVLCLVGDEASEVAADNAMPGRALAFIKLWQRLARCVGGVVFSGQGGICGSR